VQRDDAKTPLLSNSGRQSRSAEWVSQAQEGGNDSADEDDLEGVLPTTITRGIRLQPFTGEKGQSFSDWLELFEIHMTNNDVSRGVWWKALRAHVQGDAGRRIHHMPEQDKRRYHRIVAMMVKEYDSGIRQMRASQVMLCKQQKGESICDFIRSVQDKVQKCYPTAGPEVTELMTINQVLRGVLDEYLEAVPQATTAPTLEELRRLLVSKEVANKVRKARASDRDSSRKIRIENLNHIGYDPTEPTEVSLSDSELERETAVPAIAVLSKEDEAQVRQIARADKADLECVANQLVTAQQDLSRRLFRMEQNVAYGGTSGDNRGTGAFMPKGGRLIPAYDNRGSRQPEVEARKCFTCGKQGHIQRDCQYRIRREGPNPRDSGTQSGGRQIATLFHNCGQYQCEECMETCPLQAEERETSSSPPMTVYTMNTIGAITLVPAASRFRRLCKRCRRYARSHV
jgi:hypothetical protein